MEMDVIIGIAAVFVSGIAIGSAATLLVQWTSKKLTAPVAPHMPPLDEGEAGMLRQDVADLSLMIRDIRDRVEFQERLLSRAEPAEMISRERA